MNSNIIGAIDCDDCGCHCQVKESRHGLAYYSCGDCGNQHFTRGPAANSKLRSRMKPAGQQHESEPEPATETEASNDGGTGKETSGRNTSIW